MIKASAGGGGKGMRVAWNDAEARDGFALSKSEAASSFGDDRIFIEKFVTDPRHIEIQVLADSHGNCLYLGERECSIQRRNQKIIEEAPSPFLDAKTRRAMCEQSVALSQAVGYISVGTVEFIVDSARNFFFLEMNTRLQVEHPVTELVTGLDLVEQMLRIAAGERLMFTQSEVKRTGWAIESRIYAEDPYRNFLPSVGRLTRYRPPLENTMKDLVVRNDTGVFEGAEISTYYDPMIAKLCTWAPSRTAAIAAMADALDTFEVEGVGHNIPFLSAVMEQDRFNEGRLTTGYIAEEFPEGFAGVELDASALSRLAAIACAAAWRLDNRALAGRDSLVPQPNRWSVLIGKNRWDFAISEQADMLVLANAEGEKIPVENGWKPGETIATAVFGDDRMYVRMDRVTGGFRMRYRGADVKALVLLPHVADLAALMPVKMPPDMSKFLLCPMPGQIVRLEVSEGELVEDGQVLAIVEAMKMENALRAQKRAVVRSISVGVGENLAVDQIIMEFSDA